jgi:ferredoxin
MAATGREPGRLPVPPSAPYAFPDVRAEGCTLCRTCVNVCPTHAFRFDEARQALELRQVACVNCGLCAGACPEGVIALRSELFLDRSALEWVTVVEDEPVRCVRCGAPFGTRRALEAVEARVLGLGSLAETFAGARRHLLRMCPTCRGAAAVLAMQEGWEP